MEACMSMSSSRLSERIQELWKKYEEYKKQGLKLDM